MAEKKLIMFMGPKADGLYGVARIFRDYGFRVGEPTPELIENPDRSRFPDPALLWYWNAIRRFFRDMGLPPIAEVPEDMLGPLEREYYQTLFARTLMQSLGGGSFICADHLSALVLPILLESLAMLRNLGIQSRLYFFYSEPERSINCLLRKNGTPVRLSEFAWRNTVTAGIRLACNQMRFICMDSLNGDIMRELAEEIAAFYGWEKEIPESETPVLSPMAAARPPLSSSTHSLYTALANGNQKEMEAAALLAWRAQSEQNGWQYLDCLEYRRSGRANFVDDNYGISAESCGWQTTQGTQGQSLMGAESMASCMAPIGLPGCADEAAWLGLLDSAESASLNIRNEYVLKLFRHADSLGRDYMGTMADMRRISELSKMSSDPQE